MTADHVLMTRMLFVDAIVGAGFPNDAVADHAIKGGLASKTWNSAEDIPFPVWNKRILETLSTDTLQDLYTSLKLHEVAHGA